MIALPNYLYQYPHSQRFYFRLRIPREICRKLCLNNPIFISSLHTANKQQARCFALFIKTKIEKDFARFMPLGSKEEIENAIQQGAVESALKYVKERKAQVAKEKRMNELRDEQLAKQNLDSRELEQQIRESIQFSAPFEPKNWDFRAYLKDRFKQYLTLAKQSVNGQTQNHIDVDSLPQVSDPDIQRYEQHLKDSIEQGDSTTTYEQLAHKAYLGSYLDDYAAFLSSREYEKHSEQDIENMSLNLNSTAENAFKSDGHGEDYLRLIAKDPLTGEISKTAINRFIAKHGWLEFQFKLELMKQIKAHAANFNSFTDEEFESQSIAPAQLKQYEEVFSTFSDTVEMIAQLKRDDKEAKKQSKAIRFKETYLSFIADKTREVKPDTVNQYHTSFNFFFEVLGDDYDLTQLDKAEAVRVKNILRDKPANSEKGRDSDKISAKTFNRYLSNFGAFLTWCDEQGLDVQTGLFSKFMLNITKANTNQRRKFTLDEINAIKDYEPKAKKEASGIREDVYWFPKVALYTGMRLNEIAELHTYDIIKEDGIYCFSLEDKDLKTRSANRIVPIHSKLIEYGFLDFVQSKRDNKQKVIFSQIRAGKAKPSKSGWGEKISKWFNRTLLKNIGLGNEMEETGYMVDFHALRKTFVSRCKKKGLNDYIIRQLVGHSEEHDITFGLYGSEENTGIEVMKQLIERIDY